MKLIIADDLKLLRESFKHIIENNSDIKVVACASNGKEAFDYCENLSPDVVLMDIAMPICDGIKSTKMIKSKYPNIKVLILTASHEDWAVSESINSGADGYILKDMSAEELILSIKSAAMGLGIIHKEILHSVPINSKEQSEVIRNKILNIHGMEIDLTERQIKIIKMIVDGFDNKEIGKALYIAEGTVKNSISEIISKLQVKDRTQLAVYAIKNNLVEI